MKFDHQKIKHKKFKPERLYLHFPKLVNDPKCHDWVISTEIAAVSRTGVTATYCQ